ncbi:MAG: flagellar hook-basal body complex protein [Vampirovibrio sp.]|nr:flagellar hook-basal body complex protein [Vampirovibrio sp.]
MQDPFITALNTQKAAMGWFESLSQNLSNIYTPGYREHRMTFSDYVNGIRTSEIPRKTEQGKAMPGRAPTNMFIEGNGYFTVRDKTGNLMFTRLGDFKLNDEGTLVNEKGYKVQGYLLGENGEVINTAGSNPSPNPNNPNHATGGPGQVPTTEINLWIDPSNGKYYGKFDEFKTRSDGTVVGIANEGKTSTPLYRVALANFVNPGGLTEVEDHMFISSDVSGLPVAGTGEVREGLLEKSNVSLKEQVSYLQQAKLQLDVTSKLISTNKNLLEEALRLIQ